MNVLVTGAAGFLGSHLMLRHLMKGDVVLGIDNFCSSRRNSAHVILINSICDREKNGMLLEGDITEDYELRSCLSKFEHAGFGDRFDLIYNFACPASPPVYLTMPVSTMLTCVVGTNEMLSIAKRHNSIIVHASTSEIYGNPEQTPQKESYAGCVNSYGPRAKYDEGKRAAESLCYDYLDHYGVDARLVRIFNTYGPNMDPSDGRVISNFICQALKGEPLTVYGDGKQTRSFCYVDDMIDGIIAVGSLKENPRGPINLGNDGEFTVLELAQMINAKIGVDNLIEFKSLPKDDPTQRRPDITRANKLLRWHPTIELSKGLDASIAYFRQVFDTYHHDDDDQRFTTVDQRSS